MPQHNQLSLSPALDTLVASCLAGLETNLSADPPTLWDPLSGRPTPPSHYAHCSLALALLQHKPQSAKWQTALDAYLAIPKKELGHHPFNRLLLLLLQDSLNNGEPLARARVSAALERCPLASRYPSNNWSLLAQLCRILEARTTPRAHQRAVSRFERLLSRWMTPAGGFIDYPAKPTCGKGATPIAYHHKALFLTAIAVLYGGAHTLAPRLQNLLTWAIQWIDRGGLCGGFGRTNHGLFGDACLLASLVLLYHSGACADPNLIRTLSRIANRLLLQQRADGLIWLTPAGSLGWDAYMHLSVYDAWFAAILSWSLTAPLNKHLQEIKWTEPSEGLFLDESAGLLAWRARTEKGLFEAMASTTGQPPQGFSSTEVELRYAGGQVFNIALNGQPLLPPLPRLSLNTLKQSRALLQYLPVIGFDGRLFGIINFESSRIYVSAQSLLIELEGRPVALTRTRKNSFISRALSHLDHLLLDRHASKKEALNRASLAQVTCSVKLLLSASLCPLQRTVEIRFHRLDPRTREAAHALTRLFAENRSSALSQFESSISMPQHLSAPVMLSENNTFTVTHTLKPHSRDHPRSDAISDSYF